MGDRKKNKRSEDDSEFTEICGWDQALEHLLDYEEIGDKTKRLKYKHPYVYRGGKDSSWKLSTFLERE